jgi:hypothetical protein
MKRTEIEEAYLAIGRGALVDGSAARSLTVDGYSVTVGLRRVPEPYAAPYYGMAQFQGVTRIDRLGAERLGLDVRPEVLDLWISKQEDGIEVLFRPDGSRPPVFDPKRWAYAMDLSLAPGDPWAEHIADRGRYRSSAWIIGPFEALLGGGYGDR